MNMNISNGCCHVIFDTGISNVKFTDSGLNVFSIFTFHFIVIPFYFLFSIFRTARVRTDQSRCHISHNLMA